MDAVGEKDIAVQGHTVLLTTLLLSSSHQMPAVLSLMVAATWCPQPLPDGLKRDRPSSGKESPERLTIYHREVQKTELRTLRAAAYSFLPVPALLMIVPFEGHLVHILGDQSTSDPPKMCVLDNGHQHFGVQ